MMLINEKYNGQISDIERSTYPEFLGLLNWIRGFQATNEVTLHPLKFYHYEMSKM